MLSENVTPGWWELRYRPDCPEEMRWEVTRFYEYEPTKFCHMGVASFEGYSDARATVNLFNRAWAEQHCPERAVPPVGRRQDLIEEGRRIWGEEE